jgi:hypothetical protein
MPTGSAAKRSRPTKRQRALRPKPTGLRCPSCRADVLQVQSDRGDTLTLDPEPSLYGDVVLRRGVVVLGSGEDREERPGPAGAVQAHVLETDESAAVVYARHECRPEAPREARQVRMPYVERD